MRLKEPVLRSEAHLRSGGGEEWCGGVFGALDEVANERRFFRGARLGRRVAVGLFCEVCDEPCVPWVPWVLELLARLVSWLSWS